jgi:hypothetical protein
MPEKRRQKNGGQENIPRNLFVPIFLSFHQRRKKANPSKVQKGFGLVVRAEKTNDRKMGTRKYASESFCPHFLVFPSALFFPAWPGLHPKRQKDGDKKMICS